MDEGGGLKGGGGAVSSHAAGREVPQLIIDEGQQFFGWYPAARGCRSDQA